MVELSSRQTFTTDRRGEVASVSFSSMEESKSLFATKKSLGSLS
jgi:hypothetical protein